MSVLIKNPTIVTADDRWRADIRCADGKIVEIEEGLERRGGEELVDASGQYVFPGGVDPHVHMALPVAGTVSADDFASGTAAALAGGTTTVVDFVHPERGESFLDALAARREEAVEAVADYGLHMAISWWGGEADGWMRRCVDEGVPSFKIYLAYKETVGLDDVDVVRAMAAAQELPALILVHAEHGEAVEHLRDRLFAAGRTGPEAHPRSRPPWLEGEATRRATTLAGTLGARLYVVHVTCREAVEAVAEARRRGWPVEAETCPQYLVLDEDAYERPDFAGAAFVIAPPLRHRDHQPVLWRALRDGVLQSVGSDHCSFTSEQKLLGRDDFRRIPGGAAGVEHRLALLYTFGVGGGRLDLHQFVDLVSTRPARIFGLYPRKGAVAVGSDADLVVWDPSATGTISAATHHHQTDLSVYEGIALEGLPSHVVAAGRVQYRDGDLRVERGAGRFLKRRL